MGINKKYAIVGIVIFLIGYSIMNIINEGRYVVPSVKNADTANVGSIGVAKGGGNGNGSGDDDGDDDYTGDGVDGTETEVKDNDSETETESKSESNPPETNEPETETETDNLEQANESKQGEGGGGNEDESGETNEPEGGEGGENDSEQTDESKEEGGDGDNDTDTEDNTEDDTDTDTDDEDDTEDDHDPFTEPRPHPHAGARYPDGKFGYVADVTSVRRRHLEQYSDDQNGENGNVGVSVGEYLIPPDHDEFDYYCELPPGEGWEGVEGLKLMTEKVEIGGPTPLPDGEEAQGGEVEKPKVLCLLYTYEKNHDRVEAVANTWGWKCDGFLAASTLTNETIGTVDLPHVGEEAYNNMWQKTRSIWGYVHDNYVDDYDYFWLGGDDFYLIVENLVNYLATLDSESEEPLLLGHQIPKGNSNFCGGGPGYVLNKMAVKKLIADALPTCFVSN